VSEGLGEKAFADADGAAEDDILLAFDEVKAEEVGQAGLVETDFGGPVETFQRALFLKAGGGHAVGDVFLFAPFDFVGQDEFQKLGVIEFFFSRIGDPIGQRGQHGGKFQTFQYGFQFKLDRHWNLLGNEQSDWPDVETSDRAKLDGP